MVPTPTLAGGTSATPSIERNGTELDARQTERALIEEARRRHRRRMRVAGSLLAAAVVLAGLIIGVTHGQSGSPPGRALGRTPLKKASSAVFARPTGAVLVFADGLSVDLDRGLATRQPITGQRAGDQRWDLVRAGNSLVVGWGEVWATSIGAGSSRRLGPVVTFVPAAERNAVWLINYPGGRIGEGTPTFSEVTPGGSTLVSESGPPPDTGVPVVGIPGGLAFDTARGVALWDAATGRFTRRLGVSVGFVGDAAGKRLAWCEGNCISLHVTDVSTLSPAPRPSRGSEQGSDRVFSAPRAGWTFDIDTLRLSPDGRDVAVVAEPMGLGRADETGILELLDTRTGRITVIRRGVSAFSTMAWSPDGRSLYFASDNGLGQSERRPGAGMILGLFQPGSGRTLTSRLAVANAEPFVVLNRSQAGAFLSRSHTAQGRCPSEGISPGVPSPTCGPVRLTPRS